MQKASILFALIGFLLISATTRAGEENTAPMPAYYELKPSLIANLASGGKYIRCDVQLMTMDQERLADIQLHAPAVRHELLMLIGDQDGGALRTPEGKEELRQAALEAARKTLREQTGKSSIDELFFTAFFVQ